MNLKFPKLVLRLPSNQKPNRSCVYLLQPATKNKEAQHQWLLQKQPEQSAQPGESNSSMQAAQPAQQEAPIRPVEQDQLRQQEEQAQFRWGYSGGSGYSGWGSISGG